jgi:hypothetical protein
LPILVRRLSLLLCVAATALLATPAVAAAASPCEPRPILRPPSAELLGSLEVLRRPPTAADRSPKVVREGEGRPHVTSIRWVPLPTGGGMWVVPLFDISERVYVTDACIRSVPGAPSGGCACSNACHVASRATRA